MPRNGLTHQRLIEAAAGLIERSGLQAFSMRALAAALDVKPASLYNHVQSMDALLTDVCAYALRMQMDCELAAIAGKSGEAAISALAAASRRFAKEHPRLYRLIIQLTPSRAGQLGEAAHYICAPFLKVLEHTAFSDEEKLHWQRVLRAIVHGFVSQEDAGFFAHLPADADTSFQIAVRCYLDGLAQAEKRKP